jgi:hypothetical protein
MATIYTFAFAISGMTSLEDPWNLGKMQNGEHLH